jgi:hypothetical protein
MALSNCCFALPALLLLAAVSASHAAAQTSNAPAQEVRTKVEAAHQRRLDPARFPHAATAGRFTVRAMFTGRSMLSAERSVFVRDHLLVEVLLTPPPGNTDRIDTSAFALRVNGESHPRLAQSPGVASYSVRNPDWQQGPRLEAGAQVGGGRVVWDSAGRNTHPRFPGDPRVPPRRPTDDREGARVADAAELDALAVQENAFPEGVIVEPVAGYLYFPSDMDLSKIRKLELLFQPGERSGRPDEPTAIIRLK